MAAELGADVKQRAGLNMIWLESLIDRGNHVTIELTSLNTEKPRVITVHGLMGKPETVGAVLVLQMPYLARPEKEEGLGNILKRLEERGDSSGYRNAIQAGREIRLW